MDRRGFLKSILGLGAAVALPKPALALLERTKDLPDVEFRHAAFSDDSIINLIEMRMREASLQMERMISAELFAGVTAASG